MNRDCSQSAFVEMNFQHDFVTFEPFRKGLTLYNYIDSFSPQISTDLKGSNIHGKWALNKMPLRFLIWVVFSNKLSCV